ERLATLPIVSVTYRALPNPAALSTLMSTPLPAQQDANLPSITTAGTDRMPNPLARATTRLSVIWCTITSSEEPASRFTASIVSLQVAQPALNISILRLSAISLSFALRHALGRSMHLGV